MTAACSCGNSSGGGALSSSCGCDVSNACSGSISDSGRSFRFHGSSHALRAHLVLARAHAGFQLQGDSGRGERPGRRQRQQREMSDPLRSCDDLCHRIHCNGGSLSQSLKMSEHAGAGRAASSTTNKEQRHTAFSSVNAEDGRWSARTESRSECRRAALGKCACAAARPAARAAVPYRTTAMIKTTCREKNQSSRCRKYSR